MCATCLLYYEIYLKIDEFRNDFLLYSSLTHEAPKSVYLLDAQEFGALSRSLAHLAFLESQMELELQQVDDLSLSNVAPSLVVDCCLSAG